MIRFECDYAEGAHPKILERLTLTNLEQTPGYGEDSHCARAKRLIAAHLGGADADIHFLVGGTQANLTVAAAALRPHQGMLSAHTGHVNVHETGAIEATGHKVLALPAQNGKITADQILRACADHESDPSFEHTVQPGMVCISQPTETGTVYSLSELEQISAVCREKGLVFYADGARLGYALNCEGCDFTIADMARLCDVFYIGGTKQGALFGEAVVITNPKIKKDFRYLIKQRGGMLAKGRLLGIQFEVLFEGGLYFELSRRAVEQAMRIRRAFTEKGADFLCQSPTNQQFPILPDRELERFKGKYAYSWWERADGGRSAVRFCTSWATRAEDVDLLLKDISKLSI